MLISQLYHMRFYVSGTCRIWGWRIWCRARAEHPIWIAPCAVYYGLGRSSSWFFITTVCSLSAPPRHALINHQHCAVVCVACCVKGKVTLRDPHPKAVLSCPRELYRTLQIPTNYLYSVQLNVYFKSVLWVSACSTLPSTVSWLSVIKSLCVSVDPTHPIPAPTPRQAIKQRKKHGYNHSGEVRATHNSTEGTLYLLSAIWGITPQSLSGIVRSLDCCNDLCKREQGLTVWTLMDGMLNWSMTPSSHALACCQPKQCCNWFCWLIILEQINMARMGGRGHNLFSSYTVVRVWFSADCTLFHFAPAD